MPKRALRVVKHIGSTPCVAICIFCKREFKAPLTSLGNLSDATKSLQEQYDRHKCKGLETAA